MECEERRKARFMHQPLALCRRLDDILATVLIGHRAWRDFLSAENAAKDESVSVGFITEGFAVCIPA